MSFHSPSPTPLHHAARCTRRTEQLAPAVWPSGTQFLPGRPALEELRWWQRPRPLPERPDRGGRTGPADTVTSPLWPFDLALLLVLKRNDVFTRWEGGHSLISEGLASGG